MHEEHPIEIIHRMLEEIGWCNDGEIVSKSGDYALVPTFYRHSTFPTITLMITCSGSYSYQWELLNQCDEIIEYGTFLPEDTKEAIVIIREETALLKNRKL